MSVKILSHLLLQVSDLRTAEEFYCGVLGFTVKDRTPLNDGRPFLGTHQRMGITEFRNGAEPRARTVDHIAFQTSDFASVIASLQAAGVQYDGPMQTPYGQSVYFRDPDGNRIEVHDETGPGALPALRMEDQ